jgi:hypothetical protein
MAGLVPAIHVGPTPGCVLERPRQLPDVDHRDKPGDDDLYFLAAVAAAGLEIGESSP